jgi:hypothetical protein
MHCTTRAADRGGIRADLSEESQERKLSIQKRKHQWTNH